MSILENLPRWLQETEWNLSHRRVVWSQRIFDGGISDIVQDRTDTLEVLLLLFLKVAEPNWKSRFSAESL